MVTNEPYRYSSNVNEPTVDGARTELCALEGCDAAVVQPAGGGRRRLYCSNAHRAEARRRRLATAPEPAPADVLGAALERLGVVVDDLARHRSALAAVDPSRQAAETARLRAETTAQVLAAQQSAADAAADAARARDELGAERDQRQGDRERYEAETEELRTALSTARANAAAATDAVDQAVIAHREELERRDEAAAKAAAVHEHEVVRLLAELEQSKTALATTEARAQAADDRASRSEADRQRAVEHAATVESSLAKARVDLATARSAADAATLRADDLAQRLENAEAELRAERQRHDAGFVELQSQLAELVAQRRPAPRSAARPRKKAAAPPLGS